MKHKINPLRHNVEFETNGILSINVETPRLIIRSITDNEEIDYIKLLGDPEVMKKFATGKPYGVEQVKELLKMWTDRWEAHNPFSGYAIFEKHSKKFIGVITIRNSDRGECKTAYIFHRAFWGKGYGNETAEAVFQSLIPQLMLRGYKSYYKHLKKVVATARLDNTASQKILTGVGFKNDGEIYEYDAWRYSFSLWAKQLRNDYQNFFNRKDNRIYQQKFFREVNEGADETAIEMANSSFGTDSRRKN